MPAPLDVYVFGAGASAHLNAPVMGTFLHQGFQIYRDFKDRSTYNITDESFARVVEFVDRYYGWQVGPKIQRAIQNNLVFDRSVFDRTVEQILVDIERLISEGKEPQTLLRAFLDFIYETLECSIVAAPETPVTNAYVSLVRHKVHREHKNCYISFNYDLLLDSAISDWSGSGYGHYHLPFETVKNYPGYDGPVFVDLLKLHGSLNWSRCPTCNSYHLEFHPNYRDQVSQLCSRCNRPLEAGLIAPSPDKNPRAHGLGSVWDAARRSLAHADSITVIGYSFPKADQDALELFVKALDENRKRPILTLVDRSKHARARIRELLGPAVRLGGEYDSFEQYCGIEDLDQVFEQMIRSHLPPQ